MDNQLKSDEVHLWIRCFPADHPRRLPDERNLRNEDDQRDDRKRQFRADPSPAEHAIMRNEAFDESTEKRAIGRRTRLALLVESANPLRTHGPADISNRHTRVGSRPRGRRCSTAGHALS